MEGVELKEEKKEEKKPVKKVKKPAKKDAVRAAFMKQRNEARKAAGLPLAYSEDEIKAYE